MMRASLSLTLTLLLSLSPPTRASGVVSSATPEATTIGAAVLEQGGNAVDAAIAISLALGVSEPAGSGLAGQTVMLVRSPSGVTEVIHGTTWSPAKLPAEVTAAQLRRGHSAASVPSTPKVLDLALRRYGSGAFSWAELVSPAAALAEEGVILGPFRARAFQFYGDALAGQDAARQLFLHPKGRPWVAGDRFRQPVLAKTLRRLAQAGAEDFYRGAIAQAIAEDMAANGGWITAEDLATFPEPAIVEPLRATYRGYEIATLPPPFGGWVLLQLMKVLEQMPLAPRQEPGPPRQLQLLEAMRLAHGTRARDPVPSFTNYEKDVAKKISEAEAARLWSEKGETTHFSVVDDEGWVVAVTQSIDSYFGAKVAHPTLGFLYNNYMQGFRLEDDGSPYVLKPREMVLSSMTGTIVSKAGEPLLVLGSPGSERIISAVAQVTSYWLDLSPEIKAAVSAYRVHGTPRNAAFIEGPKLSQALLAGLVRAGFSLERPRYGVSDSYFDPFFGGVHAIAWEKERWVGAADPRRDGAVKAIRKTP